MVRINEDEAEILIEEHLRARGWDITDFTSTRKRWRENLDGAEADRVFLREGNVVSILEAKRPGRDLWAALEQARQYAHTLERNTGQRVSLLYASDGIVFLRQNLQAHTLPERVVRFPTPTEFGEFFQPQATELHGTLRDYQRVAVSQVLASAQGGRRRMYLQMATGTGKTITAAGIIAKLWSTGLVRRSLFLVDRDVLASQAARKLKDYLGDNFDIGRATGSNADEHRDVLVTTIQHLANANRFNRYSSDHFGLVILDECLSNKAQDLNRGKYDVILANPPFGPTKQERTAQFEYHIKLYEALFIQHIMNGLRPGGRAAVVLKEGLLFDTKSMLRRICRRLVEQFEVLAVVSLPNGVFNPYSGAKTSIVVFRRPLAASDARTDRVWFYRVGSDGRDLGATRRPLPDFDTDGDLDHMVSLWPFRWQREPKKGGVRAILRSDDPAKSESDRSWWATLEDIRSTDYNLTAARYSPPTLKADEHERPEILINRLIDLEEEIKTDLEDLLTLVTVPTSVEGLKGSIRFSSIAED